MLILHPQCLTKMYAKYEMRTVTKLRHPHSRQNESVPRAILLCYMQKFFFKLYIIFYIFCAIVLLHTNVFPTNFVIYTRESQLESLKVR